MGRQRIIKILDWLINALIIVSGSLFFIVTIITFVNVVLRKGFHSPWSWVEEIGAIMLAMMVFLPLAYLEWHDRQLKVSIFYDKFPEKVRKWVDKLQHIVIFVMSILLIYSTWQTVQMNYLSDNRTITLQLPMFIPYLFILVGFSVIAIIKLFQLIGVKKGGEQTHGD